MLGYWVYMLASRQDGTLYVGVTRDLVRRVGEHREAPFPGSPRRSGSLICPAACRTATRSIEEAIMRGIDVMRGWIDVKRARL